MRARHLTIVYRRALRRHLLSRLLHDQFGWPLREGMRPDTALSLSTWERVALSWRLSCKVRKPVSLMGCTTIGECWTKMGVGHE